jgi:hypothetical protein
LCKQAGIRKVIFYCGKSSFALPSAYRCRSHSAS